MTDPREPGAPGRLLVGIQQLASPVGIAPRHGKSMDQITVGHDMAILVEGTDIARVGPRTELLSQLSALIAAGHVTVEDLGNRVVIPGFVDPHTHAVFAGHRAQEFDMRLRGKTYLEILEAGGGIHSTVGHVRAASMEQLVELGRQRLNRMLTSGTTTCEVKSGYGLDLANEIKMLEAVAQLKKQVPVELVATHLGAHAWPVGVDRARYLTEILEEQLPAIARRGLASFVDVFCDQGAYDVAVARQILEKARALGLGLKLHADEIAAIGATELGVALGCTSVDHLERITATGIEQLARSTSVGVLLPGTALTLALPHPPARVMIEAGCAVALATDCNPGSCYCESMPMMIQLATSMLRMTCEEALTGATLNAACAVGRGSRVGSIEPGKQADFLVLDGVDWRDVAYHLGANPVVAVYKGGTRVHGPGTVHGETFRSRVD